MSNIHVTQNQPFTFLSKHLVENPEVDANTLACALYLNGKPEGWQVRPDDIRKRFGWGDHTWVAVSKNLKKIGLLSK